MRITARVSAAGSRGLSRIPVLGCEVADLCDDAERERFSESLARQHLKDNPCVSFSGDDDRQIISVGVELLHQVEHACAVLTKEYETKADASRVTSEAVSADDRHAERNMARGRFAFVRVDLWRKGCKVAIRVAVSNPKGVVGIAENLAQEYALIVARCANFMAKELNGDGRGERIELVGGEGCEGIFAEAEATERRLDARRMRAACPNRVNGFCSPSKPGCPCYRCGRCVEVKA